VSVQEDFGSAVDAVTALPVHPDVMITQAPAPTRLAPHAYACTAEIGDPEIGSGRLVVLHDPTRPPAWQSDTRIVAYVEADIDAAMAEDQLLTDVGWTWVQEALAQSGAAYTALGGTVTAVRSTSYEALSARGNETTVQIRASWSPAGLDDLPAHFLAWMALIEMTAGLPPHAPGVTRIGDI
jgi:hypothetical protein